MYYHFAFVAISVTMFGMAVGALIVYGRPHVFTAARVHAQLARAALGFALTIVGSFLAHIWLPFRPELSLVRRRQRRPHLRGAVGAVHLQRHRRGAGADEVPAAGQRALRRRSRRRRARVRAARAAAARSRMARRRSWRRRRLPPSGRCCFRAGTFRLKPEATAEAGWLAQPGWLAAASRAGSSRHRPPRPGHHREHRGRAARSPVAAAGLGQGQLRGAADRRALEPVLADSRDRRSDEADPAVGMGLQHHAAGGPDRARAAPRHRFVRRHRADGVQRRYRLRSAPQVRRHQRRSLHPPVLAASSSSAPAAAGTSCRRWCSTSARSPASRSTRASSSSSTAGSATSPAIWIATRGCASSTTRRAATWRGCATRSTSSRSR